MYNRYKLFPLYLRIETLDFENDNNFKKVQINTFPN